MRVILRALLCVLAAAGASKPGTAAAQVRFGYEQSTVCSSPFLAPHGTQHEGAEFNVVYYTTPLQHEYAMYVASPSPAYSVDGTAVWRNPGAYVRCTIKVYLNPNGSIAYADFN